MQQLSVERNFSVLFLAKLASLLFQGFCSNAYSAEFDCHDTFLNSSCDPMIYRNEPSTDKWVEKEEKPPEPKKKKEEVDSLLTRTGTCMYMADQTNILVMETNFMTLLKFGCRWGLHPSCSTQDDARTD